MKFEKKVESMIIPNPKDIDPINQWYKIQDNTAAKESLFYSLVLSVRKNKNNMIPSTNIFLIGPPGTGKIMIWQCAANFEDWTAFKSDGLLYPVFFNYILECQKMNWVVDRLDSTCTASPPQSSMSSKSLNLVLRNYTRSESPLYMVAKLTRIRLLWTRLQRMHLM